MLSVNDEFVEELWKSLCCFWNRLKGSSWRCMVEFIRVIPLIKKTFAKQKFSEYFLEELLDVVKTGNMQIKSNAAHVFCLLLRQDDVYKKIDSYLVKIRKLKCSSYYERVGFLELIQAFTYHFSHKFLRDKEIILDVIELANNKISVLRIRVIRVINNIINHIKGDQQQLLQKKLHELSNSINKDVAYEANKAITNNNLKKSQEEINKRDEKLEEQEVLLSGIVTFEIY